MTEEEYQELIRLGANNEEIMQAIKLQLAQSEGVRPQPLETRNARGIPVAPGWLETAGNVAQNYASKNLQNKAQQGMGQAASNTAVQNANVLKAILQQQQMKQQNPTPGYGLTPPGVNNPYRLGGQ